jgi:hypothetical protein
MRFFHLAVVLVATFQLAGAGAFGEQLALAPAAPDCPTDEPDSVQISWNKPCDEGDWLFDTQAGCRMWDWHPGPHDKAVWSGACPLGVKEGRGVVQWFEHGQAIDRFEGTYREGKREGFGRYTWNGSDRFEGRYGNDVPEGFGTAQLAGETFAGDWKGGCLTNGARVVAIGVPRRACLGGVAATLKRDQAAAF